jgi:nucleoside-diphosphate-sugar epimerase
MLENIMKVLVIGGSGFLGSHLLNILRREGHELSVLTRDRKTAAKLEQLGIAGIVGDLLYPMGQLTYRLPPQDVIVSVSTPQIPTRRITENKFRALQSEATLHFTSAMEIAEKLNCPLLATQCASYRTKKDEIADETWPTTRNGLARLWELTDPIIEQATQRDFPLILMLLASIYGPGGGFKKTVYDKIKDGRYQTIGTGENFQPRIYVKDCAQAIALAIEKLPVGERFIIADSEACTTRDFNDTLAHFMGLEEVPPTVNAARSRIAMGRLFYEAATMNSVVSNTKARKYLDWEPEYPSYLNGLPVTIEEIQSFT